MSEALMAHPDLRHLDPANAPPLPEGGAVVILGEQAFHLADVQTDAGLWVTPADFSKVTGFEVKPEGACLDELCIPLRGGLSKTEGDQQRINLEAFAAHMQQPFVVDEETQTWSLGEMPAHRDNLLQNAMAPEFELKDRQGKVVRMSDYKGRKALIITWSSW